MRRYFRLTVISIIWNSLPAGSGPYISCEVVVVLPTDHRAHVDSLPVMGSISRSLRLAFPWSASQVPVECMMPVPMLSTQELTYFLAMLS